MRIFKNIILSLILGCGCAVAAYADVAINANPIGGGSDLDFGTVMTGQDVAKGVHVTMFYSGSNNPYNVFYEVTTPFTNAAGTTLASGAITFHTVVGSNSSGTLFHTGDGPLQSGQNILFSSNNPPVQSASFDILYTAHAGAANAQGTFHGVIRYKLLSLDGTIQAIDYLDVYVTFDLVLDVTVTGSTSQDLVHMIYPQNNPPVYSVTIDFSGNTTGKLVKVIQDFVTLPNYNGQYLAIDAVRFHTGNVVNGTGNYPNPTILSVAPQNIYGSTANSGSVKSIFEFNPASIGGQTAGTYETTITYNIEWDGDVYSFDIQFEVEILPIFELVVTPAAGVQMNGNAFVLGQDLVPFYSGNKDIVLNVNVNTNIGQSYKVTYAMPVGLTHQVTGQTLIPNNIPASNNLQQFKWVKTSGQGTVTYPAFTSAVKGTFAVPVNVFVSNALGVAAGMQVTYRLALLNATVGIPGGEYRTPFVLTLMQD